LKLIVNLILRDCRWSLLLRFYHIEVVITNEIGSYEFVGIKKETFLLNEFPTLVNVIRLVCKRLAWMDEGCEVQFKDRIDISLSNSPRMKMMSPACDENE
jgi:hypothetical protein